jgi:hypothetical protein
MNYGKRHRGGYEMGTASNLKRHDPVIEVPREYPTEWTLYVDDHPEKNRTEQAPRERLCRIEKKALMIPGNSH